MRIFSVISVIMILVAFNTAAYGRGGFFFGVPIIDTSHIHFGSGGLGWSKTPQAPGDFLNKCSKVRL